MHKPLDLPLRVRLWQFIRGLLFYNTVYWKRASDELTPPRLSRKDRQLYQPTRDLTIIRPRENPRAGLDSLESAPVSVPGAVLPPAASRPVLPEKPVDIAPPLPLPVKASPPPRATAAAPQPDVMVKRRRYRRRHNKVSSMSSSAMGREKTGLLGRLFGR